MGWYADYAALLQYIDSNITEQAKNQLKCEVIFLTHAQVLHTKNIPFFNESENLLWTPKWQEDKTTLRGDSDVVRYNQKVKPMLIVKFKELISTYMPYCTIRYIF